MNAASHRYYYPRDRATLGLCICLFYILVLSTPAQAAQQGTLGSTSTGTIDITFTQGINVLIAGLDDLSLGTWNGVGDMTANDDLCIGRSGVGLFGTGLYRILASGDGEPGNPSAFTLTSGLDTLYYNAYFNDAAGLGNRTPLTPGVVLTNQSGNGFVFILNMLFGCVAENANISIEVPAAELRTTAGTYSGTLTLLLIPE